MYIFEGIIFIVEIFVFVACANREMRIELTPCPNDDQRPARFYGQFSNIGENKFAVNGTLVIDRDIGFNSTLEVRREENVAFHLKVKSDSFSFCVIQ